MQPISTPIKKGFFQPSQYFLVAGFGDASNDLVAFDRALLNAGVGDINLIKLSSIIGPDCVRTEPVKLKPGSFIGVAFARFNSGKPGEKIASAVAVAHPIEKSRASLVMEYSGTGSKEEIEKKVISMAIEGMDSRNLKVADIESISIEHTVENVGATFAAVVEI